MDEFVAAIVCVWLAVTTTVTGVVMVYDFRDFDKIVKVCETRGHIQDSNTRILCTVEKLPAAK